MDRLRLAGSRARHRKPAPRRSPGPSDELGFARLVSIALEANLASRAVMAKLGFALFERVPSEWGELWVHALDRSD